ncbi:hypothetical protein TrVE_jg3592 [Triparma verrucosa]|uniref:Uncharacterized protein n=1 Tax=Triparma verrucosa TaxID=1606542 RepID=A0A9W7C5N5_9STRA|nr:hypothetical protein TrVE_jg3592 [Triparma verrucosa]
MQNNFSGKTIPAWLEPFHQKYTGTGDGKGLYSDWNKDELFLDKARKAIASIRNNKAQEEITELQRQLFVHAKSKDKTKTSWSRDKQAELMNIKAGIFASPEAEIAHLREELSKLQAWKDDVVKIVNK